MLKLCRDIVHLKECSIDNCSESKFIKVDWRSNLIHGSTVSLIHEGEILSRKTVDTPEVIPPVSEGRVNPASCQVRRHIIDAHVVVLRDPEGHILLL